MESESENNCDYYLHQIISLVGEFLVQTDNPNIVFVALMDTFNAAIQQMKISIEHFSVTILPSWTAKQRHEQYGVRYSEQSQTWHHVRDMFVSLFINLKIYFSYSKMVSTLSTLKAELWKLNSAVAKVKTIFNGREILKTYVGELELCEKQLTEMFV